MALNLDRVSFSYPDATESLLVDLTAHLPDGWTGLVGPNGAGKTTLLKLCCGLLSPAAGTVDGPVRSIYCAQRTDDAPEQLLDLMEATDGLGRRLSGQLGLEDDWLTRWQTLSHGERKRAQIATALWLEPEVLAIDEPTNHLDRRARDLLASALAGFRGVGILVSHDRRLLDDLCSQCLHLDVAGAVMRPGGYSQGADQARLERAHAREEWTRARREVSRLHRETARRREKASRANRDRSRRGLRWKDSDAREKIGLARFTGKDAVAGKLLKQMEGRLHQAERQAEGITVTRDRNLTFWLPGTQTQRDRLLRLPEGALPLGQDLKLVYPELTVTPSQRVALVGPNGAGKSTLVQAIVDSLELPPERMVYLPQEIPLSQSRELVDKVKSLPRSQLGHLMTVVSGLGSEPTRLLETDAPSPGETRKLLLALGVSREPWLIVMDEPTNHLDLPSIELLEAALVDCPCGLLLVSHDQSFLEATTQTRWTIVETDPPGYELKLGQV